MLADCCNHTLKGRRRAALVLAAEPVRVGGEVEETGRLVQCAHSYRQYRARQPRLGALVVEYGQVGERWRGQGIEHRAAAVELQAHGGLIDGLGAHPQVQQATQSAEDQAAQGRTGHGVCALGVIFSKCAIS
ncbi:hypothetical protein D3C78_1105830 [compost metagenome]